MRHADVENPQGVIYGHLPGFFLAEKGRAGAPAVGQARRESGIRRIVHSPLDRARETAEIVNAQLPAPVPLIPEPELREAEFGRYLQGVRRWQVPMRRPRFFMHKLRRGSLAGDESIETLGRRGLDGVHPAAREPPDEVSLLVCHAHPPQAAWILLGGRPQNERGMYHKQGGKAAVLEVGPEG